MSISINGDSSFYTAAQQASSKAQTSKIEQQLGSDLSNATDEELLDACKSFESYLVQQVVKQVKSTIAKSDQDENQYISYFGDMMYEEYANQITESGTLGIAQQLYEAMKRDQ